MALSDHQSLRIPGDPTVEYYRGLVDESAAQYEKAKAPTVKKAIGGTLLTIGIPAALLLIATVGIIVAPHINNQFPDLSLLFGDAGFSILGHTVTIVEATAGAAFLATAIGLIGGGILVHKGRKQNKENKEAHRQQVAQMMYDEFLLRRIFVSNYLLDRMKTNPANPTLAAGVEVLARSENPRLSTRLTAELQGLAQALSMRAGIQQPEQSSVVDLSSTSRAGSVVLSGDAARIAQISEENQAMQTYLASLHMRYNPQTRTVEPSPAAIPPVE